MKPSLIALSVLALAPAAAAQLPAFYVADPGPNGVWLCVDRNNDGDLDDVNEVTLFYDSLVGSLLLSNNVGLRTAPDGSIYVSDTTEDCVFRFRDLNGDGDANDAGEASEYWTYTASTGTGDSILSAVEIGPDGNVYFFETGSIGLSGKGVYRLVDLNADGDAQDPGEAAAFFLPVATVSPSAWSLELGPDGWFYVADTGNDVIWRFRDLNADGDAQDAGEGGIWWTVGMTSLIWNIGIYSDGAVYALEATTPQRVIRLFDADASGTITAGEFTTIYNENTAAAVIQTGRGIDFVVDTTAGTPFCSGDGSGTACPCGNAGAAGNGCANSLFAQGARLRGQGVASVANDTLTLVGDQMPNSSALYFQGTATTGGGLGVVFGDGLRCAGGSVIRLGTKLNVAGASTYPAAGDLAVSVRGMTAAGDVRHYQVWYRNAAAFCAPETFNLSNGLTLTWAP